MLLNELELNLYILGVIGKFSLYIISHRKAVAVAFETTKASGNSTYATFSL